MARVADRRFARLVWSGVTLLRLFRNGWIPRQCDCARLSKMEVSAPLPW
jgi:hypothetical protein